MTFKNIKFEDAEYFGTRGFTIKLLFFTFVFLFCYLSFLLTSYSASLPTDVDYYMGGKEIPYSFFDHFYNYFDALYVGGLLLFGVFLSWILKNKKVFMRLVIGHILLIGAWVNLIGFSTLLFTIWFPYPVFLIVLFVFLGLIGLNLTLPYYHRYYAKRRDSRFRFSRFGRYEIVPIISIVLMLVFIIYLIYIFNQL